MADLLDTVGLHSGVSALMAYLEFHAGISQQLLHGRYGAENL